MAFPSMKGLVFSTQAASPAERRWGNHPLISAPAAESTSFEWKVLHVAFLHEIRT